MKNKRFSKFIIKRPIITTTMFQGKNNIQHLQISGSKIENTTGMSDEAPSFFPFDLDKVKNIVNLYYGKKNLNVIFRSSKTMFSTFNRPEDLA